MIEKIESDIEILKNLIANLEIDIATIEKQLEIRELETNGDDAYFEWRASAVASASFKKVRILAMRKQLNYWRSELKKIRKAEQKKINESLLEKKEGLKEIRKLKIESEKARLEARERCAKEATKRKKILEKEKTERHRINQEQNLMIFDVFKSIVKEKLGADTYIELITKARVSVESDLHNSYGE